MKHVGYITIETTAPLKIGSSNIDFIVDMPVFRDWNELPYIPGTSITGMLRAELEESEANEIFGYELKKKDDGQGSKVRISSALLVDENGKVHEELLIDRSSFLKIFDDLPIREHTAIDHKGSAKDKSKFDEEVLYKGTRFRFSIESDDEKSFFRVLEILSSTLMLGGGNTKGFGRFAVLSIEYESMDMDRYAIFSNSLNETLKEKYEFEPKEKKFIRYELRLKPDLSFHFGSGFGEREGDHDIDKTFVTEPVVDYEKKDLSEEKILIPGSSIKGAVAHRALFYYNFSNEKTTEDLDFFTELWQIFGAKKGDEHESKGKAYFSDCFLDPKGYKVFDHVMIDRFTGGALEGALFNEKTTVDNNLVIEILLDEVDDDAAIEAFECALKDIACGMLPLGGLVMKGHGVFEGEVYKDGELL